MIAISLFKNYFHIDETAFVEILNQKNINGQCIFATMILAHIQIQSVSSSENSTQLLSLFLKFIMKLSIKEETKTLPQAILNSPYDSEIDVRTKLLELNLLSEESVDRTSTEKSKALPQEILTPSPDEPIDIHTKLFELNLSEISDKA